MPCCLGLCHDVQHKEEHHEEGEQSGSFGIDGFTINDQINPSYAPDTRLEPIHIDIFLNFQSMSAFKDRTFSVRAIQTVRCNQEAQSIVFNGIAFENLQVKQIGEEDDNKFTYTYDNQFIELTWNKNWSIGQEKKIEFSYTVNQPLSVFFNNPHLPQFGEFAVTDHETERCRYWLACVDFPVIRTTLSFHIEAPEQTSVFANGSLISEAVDNGIRKVHYELKQKCPSYLICFAIGEFIVIKEQIDYTSINGNKIPLAFIAPKGIKEEELKVSFEKTYNILQFLETQLKVPFPFPKYYQVVFPYMKGGAMENVSLTTWTMSLLLDDIMAKEYRVVFDNVNAHEAAHTYFGDALVIRHFEHVWLKESWATFMAGNFVYHVHGKDEGDLDFINQASRYMSETSSYVRPIVNRIYDHSWSMYDSHTYPGGSWRLNMLRKKLGENQFWQAITNYINKYMQKCVETEDFRRELEQVSGLNLNKFFDQWIFGKGYPVLKATLNYNAEEKTTVITVEQTQVNKNKGINLFDFDLEIEVAFQDAATSSTVTKSSVLKFSDSKPRAVAIIATSSKPNLVRFDPDMKVLFDLAEFNAGEDILLGTLKNAQDVYNRVRAGKLLAKLGTKTAVSGILNTLLTHEKFHGVKSLVAKELLNNPNLYSLKAVAKLLAEETNPKATMIVLNSCIGGPSSEDLKQAFLTIINKSKESKEYGYLTHGRALEAYANQFSANNGSNNDIVADSIAAIDLIVKNIEADNRTIFPLVRRAGYRALGSFKGPSAVAKHAFEVLMSKLKSERVECISCIIGSLASLAKSNGTLSDYEKDIITNTCIEYIGNDDDSVKTSAIGGLASNKVKKALKAIQAAKSQFAEQDLPWLNRKIEALSKSDSGNADVAKLQKEVDDLKNQVKQIQNKFDDYVELQKAKQQNK